MAKGGGLADVTGALPKYLNADVKVIVPGYRVPWFEGKEFSVVFRGDSWVPHREVHYEVMEVLGHDLGFPFYVIHIPGLLDRDGVYADSYGNYFMDEAERYTAFQRAYLDWMLSEETLRPDVMHCQDHHTGLIPFMKSHCPMYAPLSSIPVLFTIHNERYQGAFAWEKQYLLPMFDNWKSGLLDWDHRINPLASAIRCSDAITTVSPSYMEELKHQSYGLEWLFQSESNKLYGILNGIDTVVWDPKKDPLITHPLKRSISTFKRDNKQSLLEHTTLDPSLPLVSFIGRFAMEKGADLLMGLIDILISEGVQANFFILGTGDKTIEYNVARLEQIHPTRVIARLTYNEALAHQVYAGSDYILMPSRVEPCGLNQMYALRYGTIPMVHSIGGLHDSIKDIDDVEGYGVKFHTLIFNDILYNIKRGLSVYQDTKRLEQLRKRGMALDFSWDASAKKYLELYHQILGLHLISNKI